MSLGYLYIQMGDVENARKYFKMSINSSKEYTRIDAYNNLYFWKRILIILKKQLFIMKKRIPLSAYWMRSIPRVDNRTAKTV